MSRVSMGLRSGAGLLALMIGSMVPHRTRSLRPMLPKIPRRRQPNRRRAAKSWSPACVSGGIREPDQPIVSWARKTRCPAQFDQ
jgi:hypothetical protein